MKYIVEIEMVQTLCPLTLCQYLPKTRVIVKQETKQKRNETKQAETKRNETQQKRNKIKQKRNDTKRNETQQKRNKTKQIIKKLKKKTKQTLTKRFFFYMRQQSTKCQWRIEKPLKFSGI